MYSTGYIITNDFAWLFAFAAVDLLETLFRDVRVDRLNRRRVTQKFVVSKI